MGWYDLEGNWAPFSGLEATFRTSGESYWDSYKTSAGTILAFARGPERTAPGQLDAVFYHAAVFRPAGAGCRIPIGPVPLAAYVRREGPEPSDFYLGMQRAGWCIYPILLLIGYNIALWVLP